jgi:hypothetical protein
MAGPSPAMTTERASGKKKTSKGDCMKSKQHETRAMAHLPHLDIEIWHARPWEGGYEQVMIALTAKPSFEAFEAYFDSYDPLQLWSALIEAAWAPWLTGMAAWRALSAPGEE